MDDATLVAAARSGDRDAWGILYDRYADRLHDHCWSILRDEHEAADALHDTFVNAARALPQLRDPSRLRPWLYAIARNEAFRRHRARSKAIPTDDVGEFGDVTVDLESGAGAPVDDLRRLVWDAAGGLSADDQALLDLHLRQGLEGEDLAQAMGITANNAYVKMSRLRDTLERSLGALLVARTGRQDCPELSQLLAGWDGELTPLLRKRVARHIESCEVCGERKKAMVSPLALFSGMPLVPAPAGLRDRVVDDAALAAASTPATPDELFPAPATTAVPVVPPPPSPPPTSPSKSKGAPWGWIAGGIAAAVLLLLGVLTFGGDGDEAASEDTTTTTSPATTTSSTSSSTSSTTTSTSTTSTTLVPPSMAVSTTSVDLGSAAPSAQFTVTNSGGGPLSYVLTTSPPQVGVNRRTGTLQPGASNTIVVTVDRGALPEGPFQGVVNIGAGDAGAATVTVRATVGPRPPTITDVTTSQPSIYVQSASACPGTEVIVSFTDEHPVTGSLFTRRVAPAPGPIVETPLTVTGNEARASFVRPNTSETYEYWVVLTDSLGASTGESPHETISSAFTC